MNEGRTVFAQLLDFLPKYEFDNYFVHYHGNFRLRKRPACDQFLVLTFAQLTWSESLRRHRNLSGFFRAKTLSLRHPSAHRPHHAG